MISVALIGPDGAGKTTIARMIEQSFPVPIKYLYMGPSIFSGNKTLPTSRLARFLKLRALRNVAEKSSQAMPDSVSSHDFHYRPEKRGAIWLTLRLINRIAEASYRQIFSLIYQVRGYVVVYDRYFLFDAPSPPSNSQVRNYKELVDYIEYWFHNYCYPKPNLVIFLDAPSEVLYRRKGEADINYLNSIREEILQIGKTMENFVRIDAAQPIGEVLKDVIQHIIDLRKAGKKSSNI